MSTRGLFGFRKNGIDKAFYNHFDSYPEWLGRKFVCFINDMGTEKLSELYDKLKIIDTEVEPTKEEQDYCIKNGWFDKTVSGQKVTDWYCLLYNLQDLDQLKKAADNADYIPFKQSISFIRDSLFCEYAYIYDLDEGILEFYVGFQQKPDANNRYGTARIARDFEYYPCKLAETFKNLNDVKKIVKEMEKTSRSEIL